MGTRTAWIPNRWNHSNSEAESMWWRWKEKVCKVVDKDKWIDKTKFTITAKMKAYFKCVWVCVIYYILYLCPAFCREVASPRCFCSNWLNTSQLYCAGLCSVSLSFTVSSPQQSLHIRAWSLPRDWRQRSDTSIAANPLFSQMFLIFTDMSSQQLRLIYTHMHIYVCTNIYGVEGVQISIHTHYSLLLWSQRTVLKHNIHLRMLVSVADCEMLT